MQSVKATRQGSLHARRVTLAILVSTAADFGRHRWHRETIFERGPNIIAPQGRRVYANRQLNLLRLVLWLPHGDLRASRSAKIHGRLRWARTVAPWHHGTVTSNGCTRDISCRTTKVKLCLICTQRPSATLGCSSPDGTQSLGTRDP